MNITIIDIFNKRLDVSLQSTAKIPIFYFIMVFSILTIVLFPFYIRGNGAKPLQWILTSLFLGIILYLFYIIYSTGGFNV
jgi:RsiW-degrading membrane proteinase PrsW (M82 family)